MSQLIIQNPDSRTKHLMTQIGQRKPFWLVVDCNQAGTANEQTTNSTRPTDHELIVRGAVSDRTLTKVRITDTNSGFVFSADPIPVRAIAGKAELSTPIVQWFTPYLLSPRTQLKFEFFNDADTPDAEGGWMILICEY
jgi:hypothetical protein